MSTKRYVYFGLLGAVALALLSAIAATPATAHVTVQPGEATKGGFAKLAFRVPNESTTAGTVKLEVAFPEDTPLTSVRTKPMAGWTAQVNTEQLTTPIKVGDREITQLVRTVSWTAQPGVRIGPSEFTEFEVSVGPLPDADQLVLPAKQTYDDGTVVDWIERPPAEGADEPEHPAPVLTLVAGADGGDDHGAGAAGAADQPSNGDAAAGDQPANDATTAGGSDGTARWLAGIGLVLGAIGAGLGGGAVLANRRRTTAA